MGNQEEEDLRQVKAQVATCSKCGGAVLIAINHLMTRATAREFAKMLEAGCDVHSTNVIVARTLTWCWENECEGMWPKKSKKKKTDEVNSKK